METKNRSYAIGISIALFLSLCSCEQMFDVKPRKTPFAKTDVFASDATATSAVVGIYSEMYSDATSFASGTGSSVAALTGLSADELDIYINDASRSPFKTHALVASNESVFQLWSSMYKSIYGANSAIDGLNKSTLLNPMIKNQLLGEVYFVRAFAYFYLANLFGDVPLILSTDYTENAHRSRTSEDDVYGQIILDLSQSVQLLGNAYPTNERVRPNKAVAKAFLARVYLFYGDPDNAVRYASELIQDDRFQIGSLDETFLGYSQEAIWQLMPMGLYQNTNEGNLFVLPFPPFYNSKPFALTKTLVDDFEAGDKRFSSWVGLFVDSDIEYFFCNKYKISEGGTATEPVVPLSEYSVVLRLAEQYLIRAEARLQAGDLDGAVGDLNVIRTRAELVPIDISSPLVTEDSVFSALEHEKRIELFCEWGHRWMDLKLNERAGDVLGQTAGWTKNSELYPIPQSEIIKNQNLKPQNDGY